VTDIRPLYGIHYNKTLLDDWSRVICPVYDIISLQQREQLYRLNENNFVRLEAALELPQDTPQDNKYTRSAAIFDDWLKRGILQKDEKAAIYIHDHYFEFKGRQYKRRGIIARIHLEDWDKMIVRPHESTLAEAKSDRLSLIWAIQANTSSILSLYEDKSGQIKDILAEQSRDLPLMNLAISGSEGHRIWAITDKNILDRIRSHFSEKPIYIADGHHRYESALTYSRQKKAGTSSNVDEPYEFVMMTLVDFNDPGLLILPPHRLVRGISKSVLDGLIERLKVFFEIEELFFDSGTIWDTIDQKIKNDDLPVLELFGVSPGKILLLKPKNIQNLMPMMPYFHSDLYKQLEVSIIDHVVLEKLLALSNEKDKVNLGYCYDRTDAVNRVKDGEYQICFILKPIQAEVIKAIADLSDKMPKKSTYFYPKVPAGLIINQLV
jgi:uncharacterized protein (DUF1015 family)